MTKIIEKIKSLLDKMTGCRKKKDKTGSEGCKTEDKSKKEQVPGQGEK